MTDLCSLLCS